jgi:hypothetical protein
MKKIILVLAMVLIATPAWAGLTIEASQRALSGSDCNVITVTYDMDDTDANIPRAFALEIDLSQENDANIGEVVYVHPEFHVYPGSIQITGGVVTDQGTPVAVSDVCSMIVEMGSLYAATDPCHTTQPDPCGILLKFTVADNESCHVNLALNAIRGGMVLEDTGIVMTPAELDAYVTLTECDFDGSDCGVAPGPCDPPSCMGNLTGDDNIINQTDMMAVYQRLGQHGAAWTGDPQFKYVITPSEPLWHECADVVGTDNVINQTDMMAIYQKLGMHGATWTGDPQLKYVIPCDEIVW